jgi:hypothetical protein
MPQEWWPQGELAETAWQVWRFIRSAAFVAAPKMVRLDFRAGAPRTCRARPSSRI